MFSEYPRQVILKNLVYRNMEIEGKEFINSIRLLVAVGGKNIFILRKMSYFAEKVFMYSTCYR